MQTIDETRNDETTETTPARLGLVARLRQRLAQVFVTVAFLIAGVGVAGASATTTTIPDPATTAGDLANNAGGAMLSAVVGVLPKVVPFLVALWAINFVVKKIPVFRAKGPR